MNIIYKFLFSVLCVCSFVFCLFCLLIGLWYIFYRLKGFKPLKGQYEFVGYGNFFKKLFFDFPKQKAYDLITRNPDEFKEYGFHLITGKQGSGKTITLVYLLLRYQKMYPKLKVSTNMDYKFQDSSINHWKDLVFNNNGIYGQIDVIDEVQNWFSSNQSKNFPPDMLREVTQQRKQRKMIIGTSQVFTRVAKPIRENVYLVYEPKTFFGCITLVHKYEPVLDDTGNVIQKKPRGHFFFVHNKNIRNCFDTYKKILDISEDGYQSKQDSYADPGQPCG